MPSYEEGEPSLTDEQAGSGVAGVPFRDLDKRVQELASAAWFRIPVAGAPGWSWRLSMPLPKPWATPPRQLSWYAYAERFMPGLADGVEISEPWGRIDLNLRPDGDTAASSMTLPLQASATAESPLQFTSLRQEFVPLEVQGVHPLSEAELSAMAKWRPGALLRALALGQRSPALKAAGRFWRKCNGCIYAFVAKRHEDFTAWLDAD